MTCVTARSPMDLHNLADTDDGRALRDLDGECRDKPDQSGRHRSGIVDRQVMGGVGAVATMVLLRLRGAGGVDVLANRPWTAEHPDILQP